jgi:hypothetical protein
MPWPALLLMHAAALLHTGWSLVARKAGGGNHFVRLAVGAGSVWVGLAALGRLGTVVLLGERGVLFRAVPAPAGTGRDGYTRPAPKLQLGLQDPAPQ